MHDGTISFSSDYPDIHHSIVDLTRVDAIEEDSGKYVKIFVIDFHRRSIADQPFSAMFTNYEEANRLYDRLMNLLFSDDD